MNCLVCGKGFEIDHFLSNDCHITGVTCDQIGVCPACLADAKLGRLVRKMTLAEALDLKGWTIVITEEALEKAMGEGK